LPDCRVTAEILFEMSKIVKFNEMIRISKEPPYLIKIGFGKYKGQRFENLPEDYLDWLLKQDDLDEGVKAAANRILLSRKN
jgi:exodeoxyribonuclease X